MSIFDNIKWHCVDYVALTLALMQESDERLQMGDCDEWVTDIIDNMNADTARVHHLETELHYLAAI